MTVRDTSKDSLAINARKAITAACQNRIRNYLFDGGNQWRTRRQISEATGIATATVSGLVCPMVAVGVLEEGSQKQLCPVSKRRAYVVRVATRQGDLF